MVLFSPVFKQIENIHISDKASLYANPIQFIPKGPLHLMGAHTAAR